MGACLVAVNSFPAKEDSFSGHRTRAGLVYGARARPHRHWAGLSETFL